MLGIGVAQPLCDDPYDLILDLRHSLVRVQCKWASIRGNVIEVRCRRCRRGPDGFVHRGYESHEIDAIAAYCAELDRCFLIPSCARRRAGGRLASADTDPQQSASQGPLGRGLRVRRYTSSSRAHSSAGRAPAWHAGGRRFEPDWVHQSERAAPERRRRRARAAELTALCDHPRVELKQYYLGCLAHASYLVADEDTGRRRRRRPAARRRRVPRRRRARSAAGSSTSCSRTSTPTSSPATSSCATASARGSTSAPAPRPSTRSRRSPTATRSTLGQVRLVALETPGHSPESISILVYDLDRRPRAAARRAHRRHALHRRRRPARSARVARLERRGARLAALRLDPGEDPAASRRDARLPGARRRLALRQAPEHRHRLDDRHPAPVQLRAPADEPRGVRRASSPPTSPTRRRTSPTTPSSTRRSGRRSTRRSPRG